MKFLIVTAWLIGISILSNAQATAKISGHMEGLDPADSLVFEVWNFLPETFQAANLPHERINVKHSSGEFSATFDNLTEINYFNFKVKKYNGEDEYLLMLYLIEPNDNVQLKILKPGANIDSSNKYPTYIQKLPYTIAFSGKGAAKLECRWKIEKASGNIIMSSSGAAVPSIFSPLFVNGVSDVEYLASTLTLVDSLKKNGLYVQKSYEGKISQLAYNVDRLNILSHFDFSKIFEIGTKLWLANLQNRDSIVPEILRIYKKHFLGNDTPTELNEYYRYSPLYLNYQVEKKLQAEKIKSFEFKKQDLHSILNTEKDTDLKEFLVSNYLLFWYGQGGFPGIDSLANGALQTMQNERLKKTLMPFVNFSKGAAAYSFNLPDKKNNYHQLENMKGKVVFMDFWYTGCGACISYYKNTLKEIEAQFANGDSVVFVTVSIDKNPDYWKKSLSVGMYTGEHALNLFTNGQGSEHPIIKHYKILGYPAPILIDKKGRIFAKGQELRSAEGLKKNIEMALKE